MVSCSLVNRVILFPTPRICYFDGSRFKLWRAVLLFLLIRPENEVNLCFFYVALTENKKSLTIKSLVTLSLQVDTAGCASATDDLRYVH